MTQYKFKTDEVTDYIAGYDLEEAKKKLGLRKIIKLASNENPYKTPPGLIKVLKKNLKNVYLYPDQSYKSVKKAIADKIKLKPSEIITGNGSDEILDLIFKTIIKPKDKVLLFNPSFSVYKILSEVYKTKPIWINLKNFQYNTNNILNKLSNNIKLIILCNPNNPTGTYLDKKNMEKLITRLPRQTTLCIDEAYFNYATALNFPDTVQLFKKFMNKKNIIVTRTFSKIYGLAGLRAGYAFSNKEFIKILDKIRIPFNLNLLADKSIIFSLKDDKNTEKFIKLNMENKNFFYSQLQKLNLSYIPTQANFILIKTPLPGKIIFNKLLQEGIIIRPFENPELKNYIRITIGTKKEIKLLIKKLKKILS